MRVPAPSIFIVGLLLSAGCTFSGGGDSSDTPTPTPTPTPIPTPAAACEPETGGPYWMDEGDVVSAQVTCGTGMTAGSAQFGVTSLPDGATWDPGGATLEWTPGLDQAAVYEVVVTAASTGESEVLKIGVADAWDNPDNVPVVDPLLYTEEYGLPVFFLSPVPTDRKEYAPATIVHGGHVYHGEGKLRGAASIAYPKNNYTLKFPKDDKFQEPTREFSDKRKLVLYGNFDDNSHLRTRLSFDVWNRIDPEHIQVRTYSAVLFLDGKYWGTYTVADHIDGDLMEDHGLAYHGDLFKAVDYPANFSLSGKSTPHEGYEKKVGFPEEGSPAAWIDLDELVTFVDGSGADEFRNEIGSLVDLRDYQDWWVLATLLFANDSVNKNSYHYHDTGPFRLVPWDFTASFGQNWRTARRDPLAEDDFAGENLMFARFLADPALRDPMFGRVGQVVDETCTATDVLGWIDAYAAEIEPAARRDERKWGEAYRSYSGWADRDDFNSWEDEVQYLRDWVAVRWAHYEAKHGH